MIKWTKEESKEWDWNSKWLYAITIIANIDEYYRIQAFKKSKKSLGDFESET